MFNIDEMPKDLVAGDVYPLSTVGVQSGRAAARSFSTDNTVMKARTARPAARTCPASLEH